MPPEAGIAKRSVTIAGHRTSISLEAPFWEKLGEIARERGLSLGGLVAEIDAGRGAGNLSSALRLHVLAALQARLDLGISPRAEPEPGGVPQAEGAASVTRPVA